MSFRIILRWILLAVILPASAYSQKTRTLNKPLSSSTIFPESRIIKARDWITFKSGFNYSAYTDNISPTGLHAYLNPDIVVNNDYENTEVIDVDQYDINRSLPVGSIAGFSTPDASGAANYTIPLEVAQGTGGMQPNLSIVYSSLSGSGLLGRGWNLSGLSSITRTSQSIYQDNQQTTVDLTSADRFALDGNRLVLTGSSTDYGASGTTYQTSIETFTIVTAHGTAGNGPQYFTAKTKDGIEMEFGATDDSRIEAQGSATIITWCINKIKDPSGNYMLFKYKEDNDDGETYIKEITYTLNDDAGLTTADQKVHFYYTAKSDTTSGYVAGSKVTQAQLIYKIIVSSMGEAFRTYDFVYRNASDGTSLLSKVKLTGRNQSELNPTIMQYGAAPSSYVSQSTGLADGLSADIFSGDFDGDGVAEAIVATYTSEGSEPFAIHYHTGFKIYKRDLSNGSYVEYSPEVPLNGKVEIINARKNQVNRVYAGLISNDFDGDSKSDLITTTILANNVLGEITLYPSGKPEGKISLPIPQNYNKVAPSHKFFYTGDFDGDGRSEFITLLSNGDYPKAYLTQPGIGNNQWLDDISNSDPSKFGAWTTSDKLDIIDFNGDGRSDVSVTKGNYTKIYTLAKDQYGNWKAKVIYDKGYPTVYHDLYWGDFNGDRKTDILSKNSYDEWFITLSKGTEFTLSSFTFKKPPLLVKVGDFDGDGRADILNARTEEVQPGGYNTTKYDMYWSRSEGFEYQLIDPHAMQLNLLYLPTDDFNGDGATDLINRLSENNPFDIISFRPNNSELLLKKLVNGYGQKVEFEYKIMNQSPDFYTKGDRSYTYPLCLYQGPMNLLSRMSTSNGSGGLASIDFFYKGALINKMGPGFMGFSWTKTVDNTTGMSVTAINQENTFVWPISKTEPLYWPTLLPFSSETFDAKGKKVASTAISFGYNVLDEDNNRAHVFQSQKIQNDILNGFSEITYDGFDEDGNNNYHGMEYKDGETQDYSIQTETEYMAINSALKNRPKTITIKTKIRGANMKTRIKEMDYFESGSSIGKLKTEYNYRTMEKESNIDYQYDKFGNQTVVTVKGKKKDGGFSARVSSVMYDDKGRFQIKSTNPLSQSSQVVTWDLITGQPLSSRDINNLQTVYEYDDWGRNTKIVDPLGLVSTLEYKWEQTVEGALYKVTSKKSSAPTSVQYFDKLGRSFLEQKETFDEQKVFVKTFYNEKGQIMEITEPYLEGFEPDPNQSITYDYDDSRGQVRSVVDRTGTTTYDNTVPKQSTVSKSGRSSTKKYNAAGLLMQVTDNGGTISYTYNSNNQVTTIVAAGKTTTIGYDDYDRQSSLLDPDAGSIEYVYDAFGQLTSQKDADQKKTVLTYDDLGRVLTKINSNENITYTYDTRWKGAVSTISNSIGGASVDYYYNTLGQVIKMIEKVSSDKSFVTEYSYTQDGAVKTIKYPSNYTIERKYTSKGYLQKIVSGGTSIWECVSMNKYGQITESKKGGVLETHVYDESTGYLTKQTAGSFIERIYSFEAGTGNLLARRDISNGLTEEFGYDNSDRLIETKKGGVVTMSLSYDNAKANMTYKSDITTLTATDPPSMTYGTSTTRPHGLTEVKNVPLSLAGLGTQSITYNDFGKASSIIEGTKELDIEYGVTEQRVKSVLKESPSGNVIRTKYYASNYEKVEAVSENSFELTYINAGDELVAIYVKNTTTAAEELMFTFEDHLGSITHIRRANGDALVEYSFDAWGRPRNPANWTYDNVPSVSWFERGYTGHEHYKDFGLVNMNGRMYDPVLAQMLSPDNFVQAPDYSLNFNRYSYCWNNPLKYTDPSGDFLVTFFTAVGDLISTAFFKGGLDPTSSSARNNAWRNYDPTAQWSPTNKAFKIDVGLFKTDPNRTFAGRAWQLFSRFTWEAPQTIAGNLYSHGRNIAGDVDNVDYYGGATLVNKDRPQDRDAWGLTLGPYINSKNVRASPEDPLFRHEYGHVLQSKLMGPMYLTSVGLPSLVGGALDMMGLNDHDREWYETQANRMSYNYFNKFEPTSINKVPWNSQEYPTKYNPNWYWIVAHPPLFYPLAWFF